MTYRRIAYYRNILVAALDYLAAKGTPRTPSDLMKHAMRLDPIGRPLQP
jgi:hypothetical protein